jgi:hypothetical protein
MLQVFDSGGEPAVFAHVFFPKPRTLLGDTL